ncbi:DUF1294 domain-containing protein [Fusibacter ferrireducens]|uniref:DUF1294 domain-containing protein n=1 Tax=Fusibacter ferrireducens TaxID=2785058 RepID=A0ABR9ZWH5_9FIRM|nr:DUF1294 domain-containing protein [Fusibacter ferrireducens]MBF4694799.1 DUF1294 domain-containing protein [Fusibacter ferrireducens]
MNLKYIFVALTVVNVMSFIMYGMDKYLAVKGKWRIREVTLLSISAIGGGVGSLMGMLLFKHKLSKRYFRIIIPTTILLYWGILFYIIWHTPVQ